MKIGKCGQLIKQELQLELQLLCLIHSVKLAKRITFYLSFFIKDIKASHIQLYNTM